MWSKIDLHTKDSESSPKGLNNTSISNYKELIRSCIDCHTTRTPCWRGGPAGPRTLCNACGIRYRKKQKKPFIGSKQALAKRSCKKKIAPNGRSNLKVPLKMGLGILLQEEWRRKLGEEEQAAMLLMALSCGSLLG